MVRYPRTKRQALFIQVNVTFVPRDRGGRDTLPIGTGYAPHLVVEGTDEMLGVVFVNIPASLEFDRVFNTKLVLLYHPNVDYSSLSRGRHFEVKEGPRTVGYGVVTREAFAEAGSEETAHLLRSPKNAERLLKTLARSEGGEGIPMTIEELRAAVGFDETEKDEEEKGS